MAEGKSNLTTDLKTAISKFDQEYRQGMKDAQMNAPDHLQGLFIEHEKKLNALLESEKTVFQELEKSEDVYRIAKRKLDEDIEKYNQNAEKLKFLFFVLVTQGKFDGRMTKLADKQKALRKRIMARKQQIGAREIEKLRGFYNLAKARTADGDVEGLKTVGEMEKDLMEMEGELEKLKLWDE